VRPDPFAWSVPWVGFVLHTDALFTLTGVLVGMAALRVAARGRGLQVPTYVDLLNIGVWAIVGGRAWYVAQEWHFFVRYPLAAFAVQDGGIAMPGVCWVGSGGCAARWALARSPGRPCRFCCRRRSPLDARLARGLRGHRVPGRERGGCALGRSGGRRASSCGAVRGAATDRGLVRGEPHLAKPTLAGLGPYLGAEVLGLVLVGFFTVASA